VAYLALLEFLGRNRIDWMPPSTDETVVGERRPPGVGRVRAVGMVARFVVEDVDQEIRGKVARLRKHRRTAAKRRPRG
jgi:hypothetical protein